MKRSADLCPGLCQKAEGKAANTKLKRMDLLRWYHLVGCTDLFVNITHTSWSMHIVGVYDSLINGNNLFFSPSRLWRNGCVVSQHISGCVWQSDRWHHLVGCEDLFVCITHTSWSIHIVGVYNSLINGNSFFLLHPAFEGMAVSSVNRFLGAYDSLIDGDNGDSPIDGIIWCDAKIFLWASPILIEACTL